MSSIKIGNFFVGDEYSPFIIAEAGINHNGEIDKALKMIEVAKFCGANAIKFQTFKAEEFIEDKSLTYTYRSQGKDITESMFEMFKRYEFLEHEWYLIKKKCDELDIMFLSTPQNISDLKLLLKIGVSALKVGSDDLTNTPLLKEYAKTNLPLILSTGMANFAEVFNALDAIKTFDGYPTILLVCTSQYPTESDSVNLLRLKTLKNAFPKLILGFSDHTQGPLASFLAVGLGARVFEKHFTLSNDLPGPDHWFSENTESLKSWIEHIHLASKMLGSDVVRATSSELSMKKIARRSVTVISDVKKGEILSEENISLRRPGLGMPADFFEKIVGKRATKNFTKNYQLTWGDFE